MNKLVIDQLQVVSFETSALPELLLPGASGEDCFSRMSVCCSTSTL
jgi:hypothetical protein